MPSDHLIKRLISQEKWLDLLQDFRNEEGIAKHFNMSIEQLHEAKNHWGIN